MYVGSLITRKVSDLMGLKSVVLLWKPRCDNSMVKGNRHLRNRIDLRGRKGGYLISKVGGLTIHQRGGDFTFSLY